MSEWFVVLKYRTPSDELDDIALTNIYSALAPALAYEHRASDTDIGRRGVTQRQNRPLTLPIGSLPSNAPRSARTGLLDW